jgi:hypothetical protein
MNMLKPLGAVGAALMLSASACIEKGSQEQCLLFNQFKHRQELPGNPYIVGDWWLLATDPKIVMYDPSTDKGPKGMVGPLIKGAINFTHVDPKRSFERVTVTYLSYNVQPTRIRLLSPAGARIEEQLLDAKPQNVALSRTLTPQGKFSQVYLSNVSGEGQIASICAR